MKLAPLIKLRPWDTAALGISSWEILEYSESALQLVTQKTGHFTIKVPPLADKRLLHEYGFYYCDTLIEPCCNLLRLRQAHHPDATISKKIDVEQALLICHGAFIHNHFHRDFNVSMVAADSRYDKWLSQLCEMGQVFGLYWRSKLAGFIAYSENNLVLHALAEKYRGKGLAKYWWSAVCCELLSAGYDEIKSSISISNLAVLNLYASLGFVFNHPQNIYHCFLCTKSEKKPTSAVF